MNRIDTTDDTRNTSSHPVRWRRLGLLLALVLLTPLTLITSPHASADQSRGIEEVTAHDASIRVSGTAQPDSTIRVHVLGAQQNAEDWQKAAVVGISRSDANGGFSVELARTTDAGADRLYDQFFAEDDSGQIGGSHFVDHYALTPISTLPYPKPPTEKGLVVAQLTDDAEQLGIGHSLVNVSVNRLMLPAPDPDGGSIVFRSGGRTWWFDADRVGDLDHTFRVLTDNGVVPSVILKIEANRPGRDVAELVHPNAVPGAVPGEQYMINTVTAQGVEAFTAAMEFMTQRWTRPDGKYGLVPNWIVGNEVDSAFKWMNMGEATLPEFIAAYSRAVRIVDQAAHKAYGSARTLVPLDYCWTISCDRNPDEAHPTRFYHGRDVIDALAARMQADGDVAWGVAYHPYPENFFRPEVWQDTVPDDFGTNRITPKNLQVLPRYLDQPQLRFRGQRRLIAATEWGCQTRSYRNDDLLTQAACFAYSAYKMRFTPGIAWFNYFRDLDYEVTSSSPLQFGIWATDPDQPGVRQPVGEPKPIYDVMRDIDTDRSLRATEFAKKIIGIRSWKEVIPNFDPDALPTRDRPITGPAEVDRRPIDLHPISDFTHGTDDWRYADNATAVAVVDGALRVAFSAKAAKQRSGARVDVQPALDARPSPTLSLRIRTDGDQRGQLESNTTWSTTVRIYSDRSPRLDAQARVKPDGAWHTVTVDLGDWPGRRSVTGVKVQLSAASNRALAASFDLDDVGLARRAVPAGRPLPNLDVGATVAVGALGDTGPGNHLRLTVGRWAALDQNHARVVACDGVSTRPSEVSLAGLALGATRSTDLEITGWDPKDPQAPVLCLTVSGQLLPARVMREVPEPPPTPPAPDAHPHLEYSDDFSADTSAHYDQFAVQPENNAVPESTFGGGSLKATSDRDWYGAYRTSVSPTGPKISTTLTIKSFAPNGIGNVVYTGLVKDARNDVMGVYVKSAHYAAFEVRIDGKSSLSGQIPDLDLPDGTQIGFSLDGPAASLWADTGSGWHLLGDTVLRQWPDLNDSQERADWKYGFSLRSLAGETITTSLFQGRTRP